MPDEDYLSLLDRAKTQLPETIEKHERFTVPEPDSVSEVGTAGSAVRDFTSTLNPHSLETVTAKCESTVAELTAGKTIQFERLGYFTPDPDTAPGKPVFNRTITLKDTWAKIEKKGN